MRSQLCIRSAKSFLGQLRLNLRTLFDRERLLSQIFQSEFALITLREAQKHVSEHDRIRSENFWHFFIMVLSRSFRTFKIGYLCSTKVAGQACQRDFTRGLQRAQNLLKRIVLHYGNSKMELPKSFGEFRIDIGHRNSI